MRLLVLLSALLIIRVTISVLLSYQDYVPPNFDSDFLRGRQRYFRHGYQWAFYAHIASGPFTLVAGMMLMSEQLRRRFGAWHRRLGRIQTICVLVILTPSGLWMAWYAQTGRIAGAGFATLAIATAACTGLGWKSAVERRFHDHRRWMWRSFLLLCSAVTQRIIGGLGTVAGVEGKWSYQLSSWVAWLIPLLIFELVQRHQANRNGHG